eukprot:symbB.v1.2.023120.t1/scaffold2087.1/size89970/5
MVFKDQINDHYGNGLGKQEWRALQELWQGLQSELREVKERAKRQEQEVLAAVKIHENPCAHATSAVRSDVFQDTGFVRHTGDGVTA